MIASNLSSLPVILFYVVLLLKQIAEPPVEPLVSTLPAQHMCGSYTARKGYCEVVVLAHGAHGLPFKSDGRPPRPYIAGFVNKNILGDSL